MQSQNGKLLFRLQLSHVRSLVLCKAWACLHVAAVTFFDTGRVRHKQLFFHFFVSFVLLHFGNTVFYAVYRG
jgi:hypothetical protein